MANSIAIDLSKYGINGPVSIREPTGADQKAVKKFLNDSKRKSDNNETDDFGAALFLLTKVIVDAPFTPTMATLEQMPLRVLNILSTEVHKLTLPLAENGEKQSSPDTEPEV